MVDQVRSNNIQQAPQTKRSDQNPTQGSRDEVKSYFSSQSLVNESFLGGGLGNLGKTLAGLPLTALGTKDFSKPEFKEKIDKALEYVSGAKFLNDMVSIMSEAQKSLKSEPQDPNKTTSTDETQTNGSTSKSSSGFSALFEMLRLIAETSADRRESSQERMWSERDNTKNLQDKSLKKQDQANEMRAVAGGVGAGMQFAEAGVQARGAYNTGQVGNTTGSTTTGDSPQVTQSGLTEGQMQRQQAQVDSQTKTRSSSASGVAGIASTAMEKRASDLELEASKLDKRAELNSMSREDMLKWAQDIQSQMQSMLSTIQSILSQLVGLIGQISGAI